MVIKDLLTFYKYHEGVQRVGLDLSQLYEDEKERRKFDDRYKGFKAANPLKKGVFALKGDIITYLTEEIIPKKTNDKKPLLLLFGNPAPQSVKTKMFFAREISGKEHRIWSVLENTGFLKFNFDESKIKTINEVNEARKKAL